MGKTKDWLDREYGSISPISDPQTIHFYTGNDEENQRPLMLEVSAAEEADKLEARFLLLWFFSAVCFVITGIFVLALLTARLSKDTKES
ncbi:hypothetical protein N7539_007857 [Penicillium diatomitis]|uniref:Uncharacterized protein n=1 Tax=Penicillium diatomitis TaxID=2819901 RepID=A0A9X0BNC8_9EURO|nr:uncharacterized protein N7539_007857 [Penicillium diatomitis]KAJ5475570.1 hypothetical protein N7539_007857 [Penicillium diatomitis]